MRVAVVSDLLDSGGAASAANRLRRGLERIGEDVIRLAIHGPCGNRGPRTIVIDSGAPGPLWIRALRRMDGPASLDERLDSVQRARRFDETMDRLTPLSPDVISLHNVHYAGWGAGEVARLVDLAPVVWTLHDMWSFTGRCAYARGCEKFVGGCDASCPTPDEYPALAPDRIGPAWEEKRDLLSSGAPLVAVSPSEWLAGEARCGLWRHGRVEVIPYGLDLEAFRPEHRDTSRAELGIDLEGPVLAALSDPGSEGRKGERFLAAALESLDRMCTLIVFGRGRIEFENPKVSVLHLGFLDDVLSLRTALSAADAFVFPTEADNLPNILLEALACGTPSVAFDVGGVSEIVSTGETGWLVEEATAEGLASALEEIVAGGPRPDMRRRCREVAEQHYGLALQARRYQALFEEISTSQKVGAQSDADRAVGKNGRRRG